VFAKAWSRPLGRTSIIVLVGVALLGVLGPLLAPYGPLVQDTSATLQGPTAAHWLGTDNLGRDVLSRLLAGAPQSLLAAFEAVAIGFVLGVIPALFSVYLGRAFEWVSLRLMDALMTLPFMVFAVAMAALLGNGLHQAMFAVGILISPVYFRVTRAATLSFVSTQYVEAAELLGASPLWVLRKHVWHKVLPTVAVTTASLIGVGLIIVSSLTFLGIGVQPPEPTWGGMLASDLGYLYQRPWGPLIPGFLIVVTVGAFNGLADALRDATGQPSAANPSAATPSAATKEAQNA
jgi:peptide/nickel transport system permease protein